MKSPLRGLPGKWAEAPVNPFMDRRNCGMIHTMDISRFDFPLPEELIARFPAPDRDQSRLMVVDRSTGSIRHHYFHEIVSFITSDEFLVINNTQVIPARMFASINGTKVEILMLRHQEDFRIEALTRPAKKFKIGTKVVFNESLSATVTGVGSRGKRILQLSDEYRSFLNLGYAPLPPYIKRKYEEAKTFKTFDLNRYQTIYAKNPGSIAAPTAGLHFSPELFKKIRNVVEVLEVTLSVGEATFQTISVSDVRMHQMGEEHIYIPSEILSRIKKLKKTKHLMAVGTTAVRALETAARLPAPAETFYSRLFIYPGYRFQMVDKLITNFHLPKSSLFILVSALAGLELMQEAYRIAVDHKYRFFSYGDAMLIL